MTQGDSSLPGGHAVVGRWRWRAIGRRLVPEWMGRELRIIVGARALMSSTRALTGIAAPVYLAEEGFSALTLGALFLVVALSSAVLSSGVGLLSDRTGRRLFMVAVPLLAAAAAAAFAFGNSPILLFVAAAAGSFGRGSGAGSGTVGPYQPAEAALTLEVVPTQRRNDAFGRLAFASAAGAVLGGLLALTAPPARLRGAAALSAYRPLFLLGAVLATAAGLLALWLREPPPRAPVDGGRRRIRLPRRSLPILAKLGTVNAVNGVATGMFGPFLAYWLYRRFGVGAGEIGVLFAIINAVSAASTLAAAEIARRVGLVRTIATARAMQALLMGLLAIAPTFGIAGALCLVRMVVQRVALPLRQSYAVAMAHHEERASVAALSQMPSQVATSASPALSGWLLDSVSLELPFEIAGAFQLLSAATFWLFFRRLPSEEERVQVAVGEAAS